MLLHISPQGAEHLRHRGQPVALLDAQAGGVDDGGRLPRPQGGHGRQRGHQIGALGHVQLRRAGPGQAGKLLPDHPVALNGAGVQPLHVHPVAQECGGKPEGGVGPVPLDGQIPVAVRLVPRHPEAPVPVVLRRDAELGQGVQGHVHIAPALQRGGEDKLAVPLQQGEGVEQAGDELGGHVAGQGIDTGRQPPLHGEHSVFQRPGDPLLRKEAEIGLLRPLHEPPVAGEPAAPLEGQGHGDQKPQSGARLAAVHNLRRGRLKAVHQVGPADYRAVGGGVRVQGAHTAQGGLDVLGQLHIGQAAHPVGQGGGDDQPVGLGLGGRRGDGAAQGGGGDGDVHRSSSSSRDLGIRWGTARPMRSRRITEMSSPAPFLSSPTAAA